MPLGNEFEDVGNFFESVDITTFDDCLIAELAKLLIHIFDGQLLLHLNGVIDELHAQAHDVLEEVSVRTLIAILHVREGEELLFGVQDVFGDAGKAHRFVLLDGVNLERHEGRLDNFVGEPVFAKRIEHVQDPRELEGIKDPETIGLVVLGVRVFLHPPVAFFFFETDCAPSKF